MPKPPFPLSSNPPQSPPDSPGTFFEGCDLCTPEQSERGRDLCTPEQSERGRDNDSKNAPRREKRCRGRDLCTPEHSERGRDLGIPEHSERGRGAPFGNTNALKHGFYSPRFKPAELHDLETCSPDGLNDEILMLRVFIRRALDRSEHFQQPVEYLSMLRALSQAARSITALLRVQHILGSSTDDFSLLLKRAAAEVRQEFLDHDSPEPEH